MKKLSIYCPFLILIFIFTSCEKSPDDIDKESFWQVYEENRSEIYVGSGNIVGEPSVPALVLDGSILPGATYTPSVLPLTIHGTITSGILSIEFPETLNLSNEYSSEYTGGVKIARVHIQAENYRNNHIALHKLNEQISSVIIYYTDKDSTYKTYDGSDIQLKAGWNFWDEKNNIISQDINDFLDKGYRWCWEYWM